MDLRRIRWTFVFGFLLGSILFAPFMSVGAMKRHHAFLRPAYNPVVGGRQLSRMEIAEAIRTDTGGFYFPGAIGALVEQLRQILPIDSRETLAYFLMNAEVHEIPCSNIVGEDGMLETVWIDDGGRTGLFRRTCYSGETVFVWQDRAFMSSRCGQYIIDERPVPSRRETPGWEPMVPEPVVQLPLVQEEQCRPIPEDVRRVPEPSWIGSPKYRERVLILFSDPRDRGIWDECNHKRRCSGRCIAWITGRGRYGSTALKEAERVRFLTGQDGSRERPHTAFEGITRMPNPNLLQGTSVVCEEGTHNFWQVSTMGVHDGLW